MGDSTDLSNRPFQGIPRMNLRPGPCFDSRRSSLVPLDSMQASPLGISPSPNSHSAPSCCTAFSPFCATQFPHLCFMNIRRCGIGTSSPRVMCFGRWHHLGALDTLRTPFSSTPRHGSSAETVAPSSFCVSTTGLT